MLLTYVWAGTCSNSLFWHILPFLGNRHQETYLEITVSDSEYLLALDARWSNASFNVPFSDLCVWKSSFTFLVGNIVFWLAWNYSTYISTQMDSCLLFFPAQNAFPCNPAQGYMLRNHSHYFQISPIPDVRCNNVSLLVPLSDLIVCGNRPSPTLFGTQSFYLRGSMLLTCLQGGSSSNLVFLHKLPFLGNRLKETC